MILVPGYKEVTVRQEGTTVQVIQDGRLLLELPWQVAQALSKALHHKGKLAEEIAKHEQVVLDQAILLRSGVGVGLAVNPDLIKMANTEAAWNTPLRRYIRTSKQEKAGTVFAPQVFRHPKKPAPKE